MRSSHEDLHERLLNDEDHDQQIEVVVYSSSNFVSASSASSSLSSASSSSSSASSSLSSASSSSSSASSSLSSASSSLSSASSSLSSASSSSSSASSSFSSASSSSSSAPSRPMSRIAEAESELLLCFSILRSQLYRLYRGSALKNGTFYSANIGAMATTVVNMVNNAAAFNSAFARYDATIEPHPRAWIHHAITCREYYSFEEGHARNYVMSYISKPLCNEDVDWLSLGSQNCSTAFQNVCDGPGMWRGYSPVTIIFGIAIPAILVLGGVISKLRHPKKYTLNDIPAEKADLIKRYAQKYQITITDNTSLSEIKNAFEDKLQKTRSFATLLLASRSPAAGMNKLFSAVHSEPRTINIIAEFAGLKEPKRNTR